MAARDRRYAHRQAACPTGRLLAIAALVLLARAQLAEAGGPTGRRDVVLLRHHRAEATHPRHGRIDKATYRQARKASLALLRKFRPDKFYIVGVGRSPSLVVGLLKNLSLEGEPASGDVSPIASSIPASNLKWPIREQRYEEFFRHFDRFLPADVRAGRRTVVLIDLVNRGSSVDNLATVLAAYYARRGVKGTIVRSGFHVHPIPPAGFDSFPLDRFRQAVLADGGDFAEYGEHSISQERGDRLEDLAPNPNHVEVRRELRDHMASDHKLDEALVRDFRFFLPPGGTQ